MTNPPSRPDGTFCLLSTVTAEPIASDRLRIDIDAAFWPKRVPRGLVVQTECHIGTTSAHIELAASGASVKSLTKPIELETASQVERQTGSEASINPSIEATSGVKALKIGVGGFKASKGARTQVAFSGKEHELAITNVGGRFLQWSLRRHRGERAVVDYLEGNLPLVAEATLAFDTTATFDISAQAADRRFFGPDGLVLRRYASLALYAILKVFGQKIPSTGPRRHEIVVVPGRERK